MYSATESGAGRGQGLPDYAGSQQMEPLLQALRSESHSGRVLRKHIDNSSNLVRQPLRTAAVPPRFRSSCIELRPLATVTQ